MKTKEELNALREEVKDLNRKLTELDEKELEFVTGGFDFKIPDDGKKEYEFHVYP